MPLPEWLRSGEDPPEPNQGLHDLGTGEPEPEPAPEPEPEPAPEPEPELDLDDAAEPEPGGPPAAVGDDVLGMLSRMEQQLQQLGGARLQEGDGGPTPPEAVERELEQARAEIEELLRQAESTHEELAEKTRALERAEMRLVEIEQETPDGNLAAETDEEQVETLAEEIRALKAEVRARDEKLAEYQQKLKDARAGKPMADGAVQETIERQRQQIERLTEQLAALSSDADPAEIQARDARIAELEEELETLQAQGGGKQAVTKIMAGIGALRKGRKDDGAAEELETRVAELTKECERLRAQAAQAASGAGAGAGGDAAEEIEALKTHIRTLESQLEAGEDDEGGSSGLTAALRERVKHLEKELERSRESGGGSTQLKIEQAQQLREQWQQLRQSQASLVQAEHRMRAKWARQQSIVVYGWIVGIAVVALIFSAIAANKLLPATVAASVHVEAKQRLGGSVSEEDAEVWKTWHVDLLREEGFLKKAAKRLGELRLDDYKDPDALADRLERDLTVDTGESGTMTLTLAGTDKHEITAILDAVATTMARESSHKSGQRGDGAIAVVRGERREKGRVRYASVNETPIKDRRLIAGGVIFAVLFALSLFVVRKLRDALLQAKTVMDEDPYDAVAAEG